MFSDEPTKKMNLFGDSDLKEDEDFSKKFEVNQLFNTKNCNSIYNKNANHKD